MIKTEYEKRYAELEKKLGGSLRETSMRDTDYKDDSHPVYWLEFAGASCPICGSQHWCMINVTGTKVICQRVANDHKVAQGGYLYDVSEQFKVAFDPSKQPKCTLHSQAIPKVLDLFYRAALLCYPLSSQHRAALHKRGMTDEMINLHAMRGFGSFYRYRRDGNGHKVPYFAQTKLSAAFDKNGKRYYKVNNLWENMLSNLRKETNNPIFTSNYWQGVPGFYNEQLELKSRSVEVPKFEPAVEGMLVPIYSEYNEIIGFQTRVDHVLEHAKITKTLPGMDLTVYFNSYTRQYTISEISSKKVEIAHGTVPEGQKKVELTYGGMKYAFELSDGGKYFWVSSSKKKDGARIKSPVSVIYNPEIARLDPMHIDANGNRDELKQLDAYVKKPKSIWLTEGGLKGIIATDYLSKRFSKEQLDEVGRDFLAVGGVSQYKHFLPLLKRLNVTSVTTAYDMDFSTNPQVAQNYRSLINMLKENGYKVRFANWDLDKAKGIDDALVNNVEIVFCDIK